MRKAKINHGDTAWPGKTKNLSTAEDAEGAEGFVLEILLKKQDCLLGTQ